MASRPIATCILRSWTNRPSLQAASMRTLSPDCLKQSPRRRRRKRLMAHIDLIETSVRDGNQSLWGATGLNTAMMLQIAPVLDQVGYAAIDFSTSTHMAVALPRQ